MVWTEALRQSHQMLDQWLACGKEGTNTIADGSRQFALNGLMRASFGKAYDFQLPSPFQNPGSTNPTNTTALTPSKSGEFMDYRESLRLILQYCILIVALGPRFLEQWGGLFSRKLTLLGRATTSFRYSLDKLYEECKTGGDDIELCANLMEHLVRASADDKILTKEEVRGNMFIYAFAGHDTMAHGLAFTLVLLAAHPEVQHWMHEELRSVLPEDRDQ